jgi:hypothetical protein
MYSPQRRGEYGENTPERHRPSDSGRTTGRREYAQRGRDHRENTLPSGPTAATHQWLPTDRNTTTLTAAQTALTAERRIDGPRRAKHPEGSQQREQPAQRTTWPRDVPNSVQWPTEARCIPPENTYVFSRRSVASRERIRREHGRTREHTTEHERIRGGNHGRAHYPTATGWRAYARILYTRAAD